MARTAHTDPAMMDEHRDTPEVVSEKVARLAALISASKHFVAFTGAGVSTSAGIPDFRGPTGKWTREAQGQAPLQGVEGVKAFPTLTHMALVALQRQGLLKHLISQNCDGLHRRSGFPAVDISELHGNSNLEICEDCDARYFRDFRCSRMEKKFDHFTGRFCRCSGRLLNSTIDFGQGLDENVLDQAWTHSRLADVHLALGSSLTVSPAADMPAATAEKLGGHLVVCNLQRTPLTESADFQIFANTDDVMRLLMEQLAIPVPQFNLQRRILFTCTGDKPLLTAKTVDVHDRTFEVCTLRAVDWDGRSRRHVEGDGDIASIVASRFGGHTRSATGLDLSNICPTLHWVGHYQEGPLQLPAIDLSSQNGVDILVSFNPYSFTWDVLQLERFPLTEPQDTSIRSTANSGKPTYGETHREYCVNGVMEKYGKTRGQAVTIVTERAREARAKAMSLMRRSQSPRSVRRGI
eukprot:TRINITY_DN60978_c0_g1_i1.p1 TRINITY_DN60978_c0_g1~~TRINITY_DN60978_c0_g1_i1.p1  ORF type:complete len:465 (+),score=57.05 TRINITY_DN60978_c0_g1_i1:176-1570(+)